MPRGSEGNGLDTRWRSRTVLRPLRRRFRRVRDCGRVDYPDQMLPCRYARSAGIFFFVYISITVFLLADPPSTGSRYLKSLIKATRRASFLTIRSHLSRIATLNDFRAASFEALARLLEDKIQRRGAFETGLFF